MRSSFSSKCYSMRLTSELDEMAWAGGSCGQANNVSFSIRDNSAIFGALRLRRFIPPIQPLPTLPYLDRSVLRPFLQHDARLIDHFAERVGFDDFGSLDVTAFVQEKASVNVHGADPPVWAARQSAACGSAASGDMSASAPTTRPPNSLANATAAA